MIKEISNCSECPFAYHDIDYNSCGKDTILDCVLAMNLNQNNYILDCYDSSDIEDESYEPEYNIPDWCPLKKEELTIKIKENE